MAQTGAGDTIGVGIVGLSASGGWAAATHVPALASLDGFELSALSASSAASARAAGDKFGVEHAFDNAADLAACDAVDLVVVAVRVPAHLRLVSAAYEAGRDVLCEWPLGNGLDQAVAMADAARSAGVRTFTGLQARSAPALRFLRDLVADGYVGEVLSTSMVGSGMTSGGPAVESGKRYLVDRDNGATLITIPFAHTIDALTMVLGDFAEISATTATRLRGVRETDTGATVVPTSEDQLALSGTLRTGAVASVHYRGGSSRGTNFWWEIKGTEGELVVAADSGHLQLASVTITGARGLDSHLTELPVPGSYNLAPEGPGGRALNVTNAYAHILSDLREGTRQVPDFDHAVRLHRLVDTVHRSAASGTRLPVT
jgi:predicted dehydrogenase